MNAPHEKSSYKGQLAGPGLFLRTLAAPDEALPSPIRVHFENGPTTKEP